MSDSQSKTLTITNRRGLHARASAKFVAVVAEHDAVVEVRRNGTTVNGDSIMGLMMLAASIDTTIDVTASGAGAADVLAALEDLLARRFDEGE
ncbi:MAG: HPr family phosphocarrier protein [Alphaproteobacteria bacterium]